MLCCHIALEVDERDFFRRAAPRAAPLALSLLRSPPATLYVLPLRQPPRAIFAMDIRFMPLFASLFFSASSAMIAAFRHALLLPPLRRFMPLLLLAMPLPFLLRCFFAVADYFFR